MYVTKKSGFAMILAIFVVVLVSMGGALLMQGSAQGSKEVGDKYLKAQADLLVKSATEYTLMRIQGFDPTAAGNCLNQLNITVNSAGGTNMFNIAVTIRYSFNGAAPALCPTAAVLATNTQKQTTALLDVVVTDNNLGTEPIRVHERSWQIF